MHSRLLVMVLCTNNKWRGSDNKTNQIPNWSVFIGPIGSRRFPPKDDGFALHKMAGVCVLSWISLFNATHTDRWSPVHAIHCRWLPWYSYDAIWGIDSASGLLNAMCSVNIKFPTYNEWTNLIPLSAFHFTCRCCTKKKYLNHTTTSGNKKWMHIIFRLWLQFLVSVCPRDKQKRVSERFFFSKHKS